MSLRLRCSRRCRGAVRVALMAALCVPLALGEVASAGVKEAMKECLKGRCKNGETDKDKLPEYNLGWGHTCDWARFDEYYSCKKKGWPWTDQACLTKAEVVRETCKQAPCTYVEQQCLDYRCTKESRDPDCWEGKGTSAVFGYNNFVDGWGFVPVKDENLEDNGVPIQEWEKVCRDRKKRCEAGRLAKQGDKVKPITPTFCSAKCYGHNCHHAAASVCECLEKEGAGDAQVVVFDDKWVDGFPSGCKPGNLYHSMITVPHPTDANKRCLIESQTKCENPPIDEENCCFTGEVTGAEFKKLKDNCPLVNWYYGPHKMQFDFDHVRVYRDCKKFLEERGTCAAGLPFNLDGGGGAPLEDPAPEGSTPECFLTCASDGGWREVWEDGYSTCGDDAMCAAPEGMSCPEPPEPAVCESPEPEPTCVSGTCEVEDETVPIYRGSCVPRPSPSPSPSPSPIPYPSPVPTPTPSPTPYPSPSASPMALKSEANRPSTRN